MVGKKSSCQAGTRAIGLFQIIGSLVGLFQIMQFFTQSKEWRAKIATDESQPDFSYNNSSKMEEVKTALNVLTALAYVDIIVIVVSIAMAIVLLLGSFKKKPGYLAWLIYAALWLFLNVIVYTLMYNYTPAENTFGRTYAIVRGLFGIPLALCFIWVVNTHKKEIEVESHSLNVPIKV